MYIISGKYKGRKLNTPKGLSTRPTSSRLRESFFNIVQNTIVEAQFLDVFAGSGAIGFEALSRGANHVTFIDAGRESIAAIKKNIESLQVQHKTKLYSCDALEALLKLSKTNSLFDLAYVDPPYEKTIFFEGAEELLSTAILKTFDRLNLIQIQGSLFIEEGIELNSIDLKLESLILKRVKIFGRSFLHEFYKKS